MEVLTMLVPLFFGVALVKIKLEAKRENVSFNNFLDS